jgi:serine/threonine protein kinase
MPEVVSIGGQLIAWQEISDRTKGCFEGDPLSTAELVKANLNANYLAIYKATNLNPHPNLLPIAGYFPTSQDASKLSIPNQIKWQDFRPEQHPENGPVICYPFTSAPTLSEYIDEGIPLNLNEEELIAYYSRLCMGCNHLHENGLVHRDVHPANVLVRHPDETIITSQDLTDIRFEGVNYHVEIKPNNYPKESKPKDLILMDYDIAGKIGEMDGIWSSGIGTSGYASPEQIFPYYGPPKPSTDIFSLAILFAHMYFNEFVGVPFPDINTAKPIKNEFCDNLNSIPFLNKEVIEVLKGATSYTSGNRYQDIPTFVNDLQNAFKTK